MKHRVGGLAALIIILIGALQGACRCAGADVLQHNGVCAAPPSCRGAGAECSTGIGAGGGIERASLHALFASARAPALERSGDADAPFRLRPARDAWIGFAAALSVAGAVAAERSTKDMTPAEVEALSRDDINAFDRPAVHNYSTGAKTASNALLAVLVGAPLCLMADDAARAGWSTVAVMYVETIAFAAAASSFAKAGIERIRPFVYNPAVPMELRCTEEPRRSFFSRHASIAFASAVFLSTVRDAYAPDSGARPYFWGIALLGAAGVGIARVESGAHFPTDVLAGAVAGGAIGYIIPRMHRTGGREAALVPLIHAGGAGLAIEIRI